MLESDERCSILSGFTTKNSILVVATFFSFEFWKMIGSFFGCDKCEKIKCGGVPLHICFRMESSPFAAIFVVDVRNQISSGNAWLTTKWFRWFLRNKKIVWEIRSGTSTMVNASLRNGLRAKINEPVISLNYENSARSFLSLSRSIYISCVHCLFFTWNEIIMRSLDLQRVRPHGPNIPF